MTCNSSKSLAVYNAFRNDCEMVVCYDMVEDD